MRGLPGYMAAQELSERQQAAQAALELEAAHRRYLAHLVAERQMEPTHHAFRYPFSATDPHDRDVQARMVESFAGERMLRGMRTPPGARPAAHDSLAEGPDIDMSELDQPLFGKMGSALQEFEAAASAAYELGMSKEAVNFASVGQGAQKVVNWGKNLLNFGRKAEGAAAPMASTIAHAGQTASAAAKAPVSRAASALSHAPVPSSGVRSVSQAAPVSAIQPGSTGLPRGAPSRPVPPANPKDFAPRSAEQLHAEGIAADRARHAELMQRASTPASASSAAPAAMSQGPVTEAARTGQKLPTQNVIVGEQGAKVAPAGKKVRFGSGEDGPASSGVMPEHPRPLVVPRPQPPMQPPTDVARTNMNAMPKDFQGYPSPAPEAPASAAAPVSVAGNAAPPAMGAPPAAAPAPAPIPRGTQIGLGPTATPPAAMAPPPSAPAASGAVPNGTMASNGPLAEGAPVPLASPSRTPNVSVVAPQGSAGGAPTAAAPTPPPAMGAPPTPPSVGGGGGGGGTPPAGGPPSGGQPPSSVDKFQNVAHPAVSPNIPSLNQRVGGPPSAAPVTPANYSAPRSITDAELNASRNVQTPEQQQRQRLLNRLILGGTVVGLGGIGTAAYLGGKGIDAGTKLMSEPTHSASHWGPGGMLPPTDVNEYGVPVY
jgi:hypothetical protein